MKKARAKEEEAKEEEEIEKEDGLKDPTKEDALVVFKEFAAKLATKKRVSLASFFADPLLEMKDGVVHFTVGSKLVAEEIKEERRKLIGLFAEKGFDLKAVECIVNAQEISEYKVFTPKQQFDVLAKEFPILKDFESRFNLEIDG